MVNRLVNVFSRVRGMESRIVFGISQFLYCFIRNR